MDPAGDRQVLRSARIVTPAGVLHNAHIVVEAGTIVTVGAPLAAASVVDLGDRWVLPGFVDLHVHGGGGADVTTGAAAGVRASARFHARHGTTSMLATTVPVALDALAGAVAAAAEVVASPGEDEAAVLGLNLEGPFVSAARAGALEPAHLLTPDPATLARLLDAGRGTVRVMTVAPELPGALDLVHELGRAGVVPAIGHTDASFAEAGAAIEAGARHATHVGNAMRAIAQREPGALGAVLDADVVCELICDGVHLHPAFARMVHRQKGPTAVALVTDATAAAGMRDGEPHIGGAPVQVVAGEARRGGSLAGSTLTMAAAFRYAVRVLGVSVPEAAAMTSATPARVIGQDGRKGAVAPGADADLVVLDPDLAVTGVLRAGRWLRRP